MNERYTRLSLLPDDLYLDGSPILIAAGALLKDNQSGDVLVQLKMQNLHHAALTACKVNIRAFDPSGAELEGIDSFSYLDLKVSRGENFGAKTPIRLPDKATRRVMVSVIQAVFEHGDVWQNPASEWTHVEMRAQLLSNHFKNNELAKQYEIEVGGNCKYVPETFGGLWVCTCGEINRTEEKGCSQCHRKLEKLTAALDVSALTKKMEARLAEEEAARLERERIKKAEAEEARAKAERIKKALAIFSTVAAAIIVVALIVTQIVLPAQQYKNAEELLAKGDYDGAIAAFTELGDYRDSPERVDESAYQKKSQQQKQKYQEAEEMAQRGEYARAAMEFAKLGSFSDAEERSAALWEKLGKKTLSCGGYHTVGLRSDGTVTAVGYKKYGQCNVFEWTDIVEVAAGWLYTVGLKSDGTVVAVGDDEYGQCAVSGWTDVVEVAAGGYHTVGLKSDGTVVAVGNNSFGQCDVSRWTDIVAVAAGYYCSVGLKSDGTVVAVGDNSYGQCDVSGWTDIVEVAAAGSEHTVGLKSDGTVVAVGYGEYGQCDVSGWADIVAVTAGGYHTVGLKSDSTVTVGDNEYGQCDVSGWTDIVAVVAGDYHTVGLKSDGTVVAVGNNEDGQCDASKWTDIKLPRREEATK